MNERPPYVLSNTPLRISFSFLVKLRKMFCETCVHDCVPIHCAQICNIRINCLKELFCRIHECDIIVYDYDGECDETNNTRSCMNECENFIPCIMCSIHICIPYNKEPLPPSPALLLLPLPPSIPPPKKPHDPEIFKPPSPPPLDHMTTPAPPHIPTIFSPPIHYQPIIYKPPSPHKPVITFSNPPTQPSPQHHPNFSSSNPPPLNVTPSTHNALCEPLKSVEYCNAWDTISIFLTILLFSTTIGSIILSWSLATKINKMKISKMKEVSMTNSDVPIQLHDNF